MPAWNELMERPLLLSLPSIESSLRTTRSRAAKPKGFRVGTRKANWQLFLSKLLLSDHLPIRPTTRYHCKSLASLLAVHVICIQFHQFSKGTIPRLDLIISTISTARLLETRVIHHTTLARAFNSITLQRFDNIHVSCSGYVS
jgi:hypothetical protein